MQDIGQDTLRKLRGEAYVVVCYLILLFILNNLAVKFSWFWTYRWLDIPFHFVGGALLTWLCFLIIAIYRKSFYIPWILALAIPCVLGLIWEMVEVYAKVVQMPPGYGLDTAKDLLVDIAGGLVVYALWQKITRKNSNG